MPLMREAPSLFGLSTLLPVMMGQHTTLLLTLLALYVLSPFAQLLFAGRPALIFFDILISAFLLAVMYALRRLCRSSSISA